jgi:beta-lactamase superfamily II metal-dependent hydrolase
MPSRKVAARARPPAAKTAKTAKKVSKRGAQGAASAPAAAKKPARSRRSRTATASERQATIRMYNVGFGDAFLVTLPAGSATRRILFDCGSIEAAPGAPMADVVKRIVQDVTDADGVPRIDVVVATHRHRDHVSGFGNAAWDAVEVKEVWMPWTEHPTDAEARRIRDAQSGLALGLASALAAQAATLSAAGQQELRRCQDIVANALMLANDAAMKKLHSGFTGVPLRRFLPEKPLAGTPEHHRTFTTDVLPGVKVHVLGPSRERDVIRDMDPPKGESYLRLRAARASPSGLPPAPFPNERPLADNPGGGTMFPDDLAAIQRAGALSDLAVAVALDKAVNGTSLMLILEIAGSYLLFPGDAQWGTWLAAMADPEWRDMLTRVTFYKVGHHGSHNATPREFVEDLMPEQIRAMVSTRTRAIWPDIPRMPLLEGMAGKDADIARSDRAAQAAAPFRVVRGVVEVDVAL